MTKYYIAHAGTKGMHWGERRYQNEDGTWTEEGKERRRVGDGNRLATIKRKVTDTAKNVSDKVKDKATEVKELVKEKSKNVTKEDLVKAAVVGAVVVGAAVVGTKMYKQHKENMELKKQLEKLSMNSESYQRSLNLINEMQNQDFIDRQKQYLLDRTERYINSYNDIVIPRGTDIQNVNTYAGPMDFNRKNMMWGAHDKADQNFYREVHPGTLSAKGALGFDENGNAKSTYNHHFTSTKDMKIAGRGASGNALVEEYFDPKNKWFVEDFWNRMDVRNQVTPNKTERQAYKELKKAYLNRDTDPENYLKVLNNKGSDLYNVSMIDNTNSYNIKRPTISKFGQSNTRTISNGQKFVDNLLSKNYSGMLDINDIYYSKVNRNSPVIYFTKGNNFIENYVSKGYTSQEWNKNFFKNYTAKNFILKDMPLRSSLNL